ncbi:hypothetical protein MQE36_00465 [Zhouia spongiae]|uniref:Spheroidene monooxygenase n=2 Tax=Zhouia spongiae TaxID=2202721 RepID=A0ABY3YMC2_9FLAO|nr:hypothetical protein [Zhouia spongiae]UNY98843.1 hypothetical protein MQE36_00465 [Zhouia spongiae]
MSVFSYHLADVTFLSGMKGICLNPIPKYTKGLIHSEYTTLMTLGAALVSPSRFLLGQIAVFAQWEDEKAIDDFLAEDSFGRILNEGWHIRLDFLRQWGNYSEFEIPEKNVAIENRNSAVVAITIAKMRPFEIPRFIRWGRPVEKLVRDHPGTTLSLASIRFPNVVSTFSIWETEEEMLSMVHGHSHVPKPERHSVAMKERARKDFHFEFTTLRFKPLSESGEWQGQRNFIPNLNIQQHQ